jgi:hypothetical protein
LLFWCRAASRAKAEEIQRTAVKPRQILPPAHIAARSISAAILDP